MKPTKVFEENLRAYNDGYTTIVNKGSARSGKTVGIIQVYDFIADSSAKHRKLSIISQSFPHLREGAIYEYKKYMMRENIKRNHNISAHEFHVNKSIINYFSVDDPSKAIGPGRDIGYINECNKGVTFETYNNLSTRTTECMFLDYNPSGEFWLQDPENGILADPRTIVIHSTWLDNIENLSKKQIQDFINMKQKSKTSDYWSYYWKVYGEGKDAVLLEERIMPVIREISAVPKDAVEIPSGLDYGFFPDPTAYVRLWVRRKPLRDELYVKEIVYGQKLSINSKGTSGNLTDVLHAKGINIKSSIISECADARAISDMRDAGFTGIEAVKKMTVEASIPLFHDYDIYVVGNSPNVWKEFDNYKYKRNKRGVILGVPEEGQADHTIDATRYVLMSRNRRWSLK